MSKFHWNRPSWQKWYMFYEIWQPNSEWNWHEWVWGEHYHAASIAHALGRAFKP